MSDAAPAVTCAGCPIRRVAEGRTRCPVTGSTVLPHYTCALSPADRANLLRSLAAHLGVSHD